MDLTLILIIINVYAAILTLVGTRPYVRKVRHNWRTRHLRNVWGFKDDSVVVVVCSELEDPEKRQWVEPREFIYNLKYGDVDAYFEVVTTLRNLYPKIKLQIMSAGEAETTQLDLARHLVVIGGPDYNSLAERILSWDQTQFEYRSPYVDKQSNQHPDEIVIYDKIHDKEHYSLTDTRDIGYFERIVNPRNPNSKVVLIGGCHTIGVTGAVKAFSMAESEQSENHQIVINNAELVSKTKKRSATFSVLVDTERVGQTISTPILIKSDITVRK